MGAGNDDNKIIRDLGAFGVLTNYLESVVKQMENISKISEEIFPAQIDPTTFLAGAFKKFLQTIAQTASNPVTLRNFEREVDRLIDCLEDPVLTLEDEEFREAIKIHITRTKKALLHAVGGNFEIKEYIQNIALVDVLHNVSILESNLIVPSTLRKTVDNLKKIQEGK